MKNTERLVKLLLQREEMMGLPSNEYDELYELLEGELRTVKETLDFYDEGVKTMLEGKEINLKVGDVVYYRGLNWLSETTIFDMYDDKIHLNNGAIRKISDIGKDVFLDKESANKTMVDVYRGKFI